MAERYEYTVTLVVKVTDEARPWDEAAEALRRRVERMKDVQRVWVDSAPEGGDEDV